MKSIQHFIVGSSLPVVILHYFLVYYHKKKKYSYFTYSILAPLFLGLLNVLKHYLFKKVTITEVLLFSILSANIVFSIAYSLDKYDFSKKEWMIYYLRMNLLHFYIYNIIYILEWLIS